MGKHSSSKEDVSEQVSRRFATLGLVAIVVGAFVAVVATGATAKTSQGDIGLRPPAGHEVVRTLGAVRRAGLAKALTKAGVTARSNALNDPQKHGRSGRAVHRQGAKVAIITDIAQGTSIAIQKKFEGQWLVDRLRPSDRRRHPEGLRHVRREQGWPQSGQERPRRAQGEDESRRRRALGRADGRERGLVQERKRRPEPALRPARSRRARSSSCRTGWRPMRAPSSRRCC